MHDVACLIACGCVGGPLPPAPFLHRHADDLSLRQHPLGFIDVVPSRFDLSLARLSTRRFAVHIWHPLAAAAEEPKSICHRHGWSMCSNVHLGAVVDNRYHVESGEDGDTELFEVAYSDRAAATLVDRGRTRTILQESRTITAGKGYDLDARTFHDSRSESEITLTTMVATISADRSPPHVVYRTGERPTVRTERRPLDARTEQRVLNDVLSRLP